MKFNSTQTRADKIIAKAQLDAEAFSAPYGFSYGYLAGLLQGHIRNLCSDLAEFEPPATGKSEHECSYSTDAGEYFIHFDFCHDEDYGDEVTINSVWMNGADVQGDLSDAVLNRMEEACFEFVKEQRKEAEYDRGQARYEAMREAA